MGVPSITTNLAGFGCYMQEKIENPADYGIYVVDRRSKSVEDSIQQLTDYMFRFTMLRFVAPVSSLSLLQQRTLNSFLPSKHQPPPEDHPAKQN